MQRRPRTSTETWLCRCWWKGMARGFEYSPGDLAAVGGGHDPKRAGEAGDDGAPSPMQVKV